MPPEEMGELEHEMLMHFIAIRGKDLQKLAIDLIKVIEKFDPLDMVIKLEGYAHERLKLQKEIEERDQNRQKK